MWLLLLTDLASCIHVNSLHCFSRKASAAKQTSRAHTLFCPAAPCVAVPSLGAALLSVSHTHASQTDSTLGLLVCKWQLLTFCFRVVAFRSSTVACSGGSPGCPAKGQEHWAHPFRLG